MWWEPTDPETVRLHGEVNGLLAPLRAALGRVEPFRQPLVWGVGSAPGADGRWTHPLLVVNAAETGQAGPGRYRWEEFRRLRSPVAEELDRWGLPPRTWIDVTGRPVPAARVDPTDQVLAPPGGLATVGLTCTHGGAPAFLTAGHLVSGSGGRVEVAATGGDGVAAVGRGGVAATGRGAPLGWVSGQVVDWHDPLGLGPAGGYDYAVVRVTPPDGTATVTHRGPLPASGPPGGPFAVSVYGGRAGRCRGTVTGALDQLGDADRQWLTVWQVATSGPLGHGDSGSLVMVDSGPHRGRVLGHLVGGTVTVPHAFDHCYVQDLRACLDRPDGPDVSL
ncbi:hypothetical protein ACIA8O_05305 [Kitasatospora sp. NPDC051853]|uniref:hypothetical protein n=1 Tax=Kitasatospora sp. NPDC051853 TaxID=3364058 RepID=UPI0037B91FBF